MLTLQFRIYRTSVPSALHHIHAVPHLYAIVVVVIATGKQRGIAKRRHISMAFIPYGKEKSKMGKLCCPISYCENNVSIRDSVFNLSSKSGDFLANYAMKILKLLVNAARYDSKDQREGFNY